MIFEHKMINTLIANAIKEGKQHDRDVYRRLKTGLSNAALERKGSISAELSSLECVNVIRKLISQCTESAEAFLKGGKEEYAEWEKKEITILETLLPSSLSDEEVDSICKKAVEETGATSKKQMGAAIKKAVELSEGRTDNKTISSKITKLLN